MRVFFCDDLEEIDTGNGGLGRPTFVNTNLGKE
jgi:hypothetical protein